MPSKPVVNQGEMETQRFPWGAIKWLMGQTIDADARQTFGIVYINPGEQNLRHYHSSCEENLYVLSGTCEHSLDDQVHRMGAGDMIRMSTGVIHHAVVVGWEPLRAIISYSSGNRQTVFVHRENREKE